MRWLFYVLLIVVVGCAPVPDKRWQEMPQAETLLAQIFENAGRYHSLDAVAGVSLTVKGKYYPSQQFLLLERPNRLRADILTGFGQLILQMASDGQDMAVFLNNTVPGRYYYGSASYENITRFVRIPLKADDLLALLLYDPPLIAYQEKDVTLVDGRLKLVLSGGSSRQDLYFDRQLTLVDSDYYVQGKQVLRVTYDKFSDQDKFPRRVKIKVPDEATRVTLKYSELKLNTQIEATQFKLEQPKNSIAELLP
jgi:outer membrane lipoprotein-sorting protein